ncbi:MULTISPECIES: GNAT family N-acetyltransferase [Chryseobacterium]|uniref:GNAT family N-acetyltransferase n=1 Tax=Chryseobacterium TaxID=59732 RepID=UPI001959622F|nr:MULTISPECIES: GNAT family N-acetyltransferase [Chryseobacterium]MBM7420031.1 N-acetylglutamate synthase-like GNAT family acetyltransferase [Chryseobacterium sp. JUb44]MDH6209969.1 N-acetylglutamate synthase-like GNAT family acetyltransferase [Chryseobacterium sp. BIGb0186]WSO08701.1 GNAT family N-acetyltransferase [Chryseobacterium scophthalmum]
MLEIKLVNDTYSKEVIDLVLNIQQKEFNVPITIEDQPDLMQIEDFYFANGGSFWGAFINGELVGTIALVKFDEKAAAIRKMFVKKEFRGKEYSIAQKLLETLIAYCQKNGIEEVYLGTVLILKAALRFYERNHFEIIEKELLPSKFPLMNADNVFCFLNLKS